MIIAKNFVYLEVVPDLGRQVVQASAADSPGYDFETEILLSKNTSVFSHDQDPYRSSS
jgi:hypothetical protein